ncbi:MULTISPECIES: glycerol-3-phosphate dehydrogenase/oxidase [Brevibacillus]|jgi:glycerol-3-phosphate dehydrogenase|uniref:Glycerol-3-phosphate dehydrogenase n=1 Tax=Brevibacillus aydinogluensis TaxID=927786 RepID=A0AA48RGX5_9BACL|nr:MULTISPECIES: glycerol-3-phosphate dehydrogenase/oxidase [Bacillales]MBR8658181.1 glycerol-3-phosphate dehydrogenase/oxidase [Brevibacillus sp. NL20B1]MDT3414783.1 glycerol-3-phosphate dehydrogenase [Brevibacillus aydinogluensis]UFJ61131.1 glycerol-3-phosphate dehydrogenase/oxidase [Anoxybacillus sediminis]CAJ1002041.1 Glycerol-3-phosphate dehydrogenase [Brevibacillus aydinogluensis]
MKRAEHLAQLKSTEVDLLVIGGGITGAGIALDAQARGIQTGLIEMQDFAAGTSSRSTKLVHGGLRYLKQLEFRLVSEVGKERAIVYENAPHVTQPEWMLLPLIEGGTYGRLATSVGLYLYDWLAGVKRSERRRMLSREETLKMEPLLRKEKLKAGGYYVEYKTDDARLTLEVIKEAAARGALPVNYVKAESFLYENGKVVGVQAVDRISGETFAIRAKKVVNAAGPWVDELREKDGSLQGKRLFHTKGVHIVFDQARFPLRQAVYFDTPDGRMAFAIPRAGKTYVGTTDTPYDGDLAHPVMTVEDRDYLLSAIHYMFPEVGIRAEDIEASWAGIRPLIYEEGKSASEISRKDEVFRSPSGLITIAGGKLTGYRKMAEKVVNIVAQELGVQAGCTTDRIALSGGKVGGSAGFASFVARKTEEGMAAGLSREEAERLVRRYGSNIDRLFAIIRERGQEAKRHQMSLEVFTSLVYALEEEMAVTPVDFLLRRTSSLLFDIAWAKRWKEPILSFMKQYGNWSAEQADAYRRELEQQIHDMTP